MHCNLSSSADQSIVWMIKQLCAILHQLIFKVRGLCWRAMVGHQGIIYSLTTKIFQTFLGFSQDIFPLQWLIRKNRWSGCFFHVIRLCDQFIFYAFSIFLHPDKCLTTHFQFLSGGIIFQVVSIDAACCS